MGYFNSPTPPSVTAVAQAEQVGKSTITTWLREAKEPENTSKHSCKPTFEEKFCIVMETIGLNEAELAEYALKQGLFVADIKEWQKNCFSANEKKTKLSKEEKDSYEEALKREKSLIKINESQEKELIPKEKLLPRRQHGLLVKRPKEVL